MKKIFLFTFIAAMAAFGRSFAQAPLKFNYQGIARNSSGVPLNAQALGLRISITDGATAIYTETHTVTTNAYGLYTIAVGDGTPVTGTMGDVDWGNGDKYIKVEMDPAGGTSYTDLGSTQLLSVPYALYSAKSESGPRTRVSAFQPPGCRNLASVTSTMQKIDDMGTFTKYEDSTYIELDLQTVLYAASFTGASGVVFELRVDDMPTTIGKATALIRVAGSVNNTSIHGIFTGLSAGTHTVSLWVRAVNGTATDAYWDPGCFNNFGANTVTVKEFH